MKKIGLIGGLGPEATVDYYQRIINYFKAGNINLSYPEIIIYSVTMSEFIGLVEINEYEKATDFLLEKIDMVRKAGADFVAITANTPHLFFDKLSEKAKLPLISIVEATCSEAISKNLKKPGLFGTGFTMNASFYQDVFGKRGIEVVVPENNDRELINHKLFTEIELGIFKDETKEMLVQLIQKMVDEQQIDSIILGCTEFPLILTEDNYCGIPVLNTTQIHIEEICKNCLET
ncbi:MAG: amino acid racemase [Draconibacterium sp.]